MIRIEINNNTTQLTGNPRVLARLKNYLKFKHPNAYWISKGMKYDWDGYVYPFNNNQRMKTGLLDYALDFLMEEETEYAIIDHRNIPEVGDIPYTVGGLELSGKFSYQRKAIRRLVMHDILGEPHPRGIFAAAVNAGKTTIMMGIHMTYKDARTIILLNNKALYTQMKADLKKAFPDTYGYMQGKSLKWGEIMVIMVQTLKNRLQEYHDKLKEFNILLTDECDLADNKTFDTVYKALSHIAVRAGFTGTVFLRNLKKDQLRNMKMREIFGNAIYEISNLELEDLGVSTKTTIKIIEGTTRTYEVESFKDEYDIAITYNEIRHEIILQRIMYNLKAKRHHIMVFCKFIEQVEILYEYLREKIPDYYAMDYTHHKRADDKLIQRFREGSTEILITSLYLKRGMNFPLTEVIINAAGGEFYTGPLQVLGRGTRKHKDKKRYYYEDIFDHGKYLGKHSRRRISYYKKLGYTPRII